jgi:predicted DNA-binding WGR domain protein
MRSIQVAPNLFGAWSLVRSWGRIGAPGRQRIDWHDTKDAAEQACGRLLHAKQRRGYRVRSGNSCHWHHGADNKDAPLGLLPGFVDIGVEALAHGRAV